MVEIKSVLPEQQLVKLIASIRKFLTATNFRRLQVSNIIGAQECQDEKYFQYGKTNPRSAWCLPRFLLQVNYGFNSNIDTVYGLFLE